MANLLALANQLKEGIATKNSGISNYNKGLVDKIKAMNTTAEQILKKVRDISVNSQILQQNITAQAAEIEDFKKQLTDVGAQHSEKQTQISQLQTQLAEATAKGTNADALKEQLEQLQEEAKEKSDEVNALTKEITEATSEIQGLLASLDSPEVQQSQGELNGLVQELEQHINEINAALPNGGPVTPIPMPPGASTFERERDVAAPLSFPTARSSTLGPSSFQEEQEEEEPESVSSRAIKSKGASNPGDIEMTSLSPGFVQPNSTSSSFKSSLNPNANPFTPRSSRGGYVYSKTKKHKLASSSSSKRRSSKYSFKKGGGKRSRIRRKTHKVKHSPV